MNSISLNFIFLALIIRSCSFKPKLVKIDENWIDFECTVDQFLFSKWPETVGKIALENYNLRAFWHQALRKSLDEFRFRWFKYDIIEIYIKLQTIWVTIVTLMVTHIHK